ncbi:hypothetical protein R3P38DRAFT_2831478 [Favolaschia claudopus]|uniref:Uncharacterized protein n=1 Tax=Favolaschia claudopus TaxID=2862362 RepID=A0AAW0EC17_9AGAR
MDDSATTEFRAALPYAILPISPALAALHSVRVATSHNSCPQCGCSKHRGETSVRTVRSKVPDSRVIQTTCLICGWVHSEPLSRGNAALFPRRKKNSGNVAVLATSRPISPAVDIPPPISISAPKVEESRKPQAKPSPTPPSSDLSAASLRKSRPKKKGGLQLMLERNKERAAKEKENGDGVAGGLAMFLNNL